MYPRGAGSGSLQGPRRQCDVLAKARSSSSPAEGAPAIWASQLCENPIQATKTAATGGRYRIQFRALAPRLAMIALSLYCRTHTTIARTFCKMRSPHGRGEGGRTAAADLNSHLPLARWPEAGETPIRQRHSAQRLDRRL